MEELRQGHLQQTTPHASTAGHMADDRPRKGISPQTHTSHRLVDTSIHRFMPAPWRRTHSMRATPPPPSRHYPTPSPAYDCWRLNASLQLTVTLPACCRLSCQHSVWGSLHAISFRAGGNSFSWFWVGTTQKATTPGYTMWDWDTRLGGSHTFPGHTEPPPSCHCLIAC